MNKEEKIIIEINNLYGYELKKIKQEFLNCSKKFDIILFQKIIIEYKNILKKIIIDISFKYKELEKADFIMFNGSFARHSNIFNSDLDLNIMYKDKYKKDLLPVELKINYLLSKILNFKGCDRVHSIMVYTPLIYNYKPYLIDNKKINYNSVDIPYFCRENYEKLLFETFNSSRDYIELLKYIECIKTIEEWESNFELIIDFGKFKDFEDKIINLKRKKILNINYKNVIEEIDFVINEIDNYKYLDNYKEIDVKDLKAIIKAIPFKIIYKSLALINFKEINFIKLDNLDKLENISKELINSIYNYLWIILRVQIIFDELGYDLSSHSKKQINLDELKNIYYKYYKCDIISDINNSLIILFNYMKKKLIKQKGELYE